MRNLNLNRLVMIATLLIAGFALPLHAMADSDHDRGRQQSGKHHSGNDRHYNRNYSQRRHNDRHYRSRVSYRHDYRRHYGHNRYAPRYRYDYPYGYALGLSYGGGYNGHHGVGLSLTLPLGNYGHATYYDRHRH